MPTNPRTADEKEDSGVTKRQKRRRGKAKEERKINEGDWCGTGSLNGGQGIASKKETQRKED